jgi:hypothetical protein
MLKARDPIDRLAGLISILPGIPAVLVSEPGPDQACALGGRCLAAFLFILAAVRASFSRINFTHSVVEIVRREWECPK